MTTDAERATLASTVFTALAFALAGYGIYAQRQLRAASQQHATNTGETVDMAQAIAIALQTLEEGRRNPNALFGNAQGAGADDGDASDEAEGSDSDDEDFNEGVAQAREWLITLQDAQPGQDAQSP